jgi:hypothetical protein
VTRLIAAPHPFKTEQIDIEFPEGMTIAEMIDASGIDPILARHAHCFVGDQYVQRHLWRRVRPKPGVNLTLRVVPQGGGGSKNILHTVLTIAVVVIAAVATFYVGGIGAAPVAAGGLGLGATGGAALGALAGAVVAAAGMAAVNAIAPIRPPKLDGLSGGNDASPTLFIEGARNTLRPFGRVPAHLGIHRSVPPLGVRSYTEVVGDHMYLRMLVIWGYGPLKIENLKIGETPIESFDGVTIETQEGREGDPASTLIPDSVIQETLSILLEQPADWTTLTSEPNADELSIDITFPAGLIQYDDGKHPSPHSFAVSVQVQFRQVGDETWLTPTFSDKTFPTAWISGSTIRFVARSTKALRHGMRWNTAERGQYEVRVRRTSSADPGSNTEFSECRWTALRTITDENPLNFSFPLAWTALRIKATDQLNNVVDELNATVSSYVQSYVGGSPDWAEMVSNNPADIYRHVLQGNANPARLTDDRVDIENLQDWHDFCAANGFTFNMIRDYKASVWECLADIAAAGRASPAQPDGKWGVVFDEEQTAPVQHFTPRNSWGFEAEKAFPDPPHAFRVRFANKNLDWRQDERTVFADSFDDNNAEEYENIDAIGMDDPDHVWKYTRFALAQVTNRPERWHLFTDFEYIVARRGDLVLVTHDVLLVGLATGRVKSLQFDGSSPQNIIGFTSDEVLTMESDMDYGASFRTVADIKLTHRIVTNPGDQTTVVFNDPIPPENAPAIGDLFGFGLHGLETIEGLLLSIEPASELTARLSIIPESREVYDADQGEIPPFNSNLTPLESVPMVTVANVRSDESVLEYGAGDTLIPHIGLSVEIPDTTFNLRLDVQIRANDTEENYYPADVTGNNGNEWIIGDVREAAYYDLRARWRAEGRLPGVWTSIIGHRVVGQSTAPNPLQNATISVFGGNALIRWDRPAELDVRIGGEVRFRHSPETDPDLALWQSSTSIGFAAKGNSLFATLPLKPGTYLARVFDKRRRSSEVVALSTKQASVLAYANVDTISESPTFSGSHDGTVKDGNALKLAGTGSFDDIEDFDAIDDLDSFGGIAAVGTYTFAAGFDFGEVKRVRLTSLVDATSINILDKMDDRETTIDTWEDFDGTNQSNADCRLQVRTTDDDPNGSPVAWSAWNILDSGEFETRGCRFRALLSTEDEAFNIRVDALGVVAEDIV